MYEYKNCSLINLNEINVGLDKDSLDLSYNELSYASLTKLPENIINVNLSFNKIIYTDFGKKKWNKITLNNNQPKYIDNINADSLELCNSSLYTITFSYANLNNLKLCNNHLSNVKFINCEIINLDLSHNNFSIVPSYLPNKLKSLVLNYNKLDTILMMINLDFLQYLDVSHNKLTVVLLNTSLTITNLILSNNNFKNIETKNLPKSLECLDISNNPIINIEELCKQINDDKLCEKNNIHTLISDYQNPNVAQCVNIDDNSDVNMQYIDIEDDYNIEDDDDYNNVNYNVINARLNNSDNDNNTQKFAPTLNNSDDDINVSHSVHCGTYDYSEAIESLNYDNYYNKSDDDPYDNSSNESNESNDSSDQHSLDSDKNTSLNLIKKYRSHIPTEYEINKKNKLLDEQKRLAFLNNFKNINSSRDTVLDELINDLDKRNSKISNDELVMSSLINLNNISKNTIIPVYTIPKIYSSKISVPLRWEYKF